MNPLHTVPITILPLAVPTESEALLARLSDYFRKHTYALRTARDPIHTERVLKIAAHSQQMWCTKWVNPANGKWLLVVADKAAMPNQPTVHATLQKPEMIQTLERWTK